MSDLLRKLENASTEDLLEEDRARLDQFWDEIKGLIDEFADRHMPSQVTNAILAAIERLEQAIAIARRRVLLKEDLDNKSAQLAKLEEELEREGSEEGRKRLREQIEALQRQMQLVENQLEVERRRLADECEQVAAAVSQIRIAMNLRYRKRV
ncbi:hypothetical protein ABM187_001888 [Stenotrophomonas maltophilia]|uniref:hypothetical protein n=1 Tax=Stenotrophomonas maltophilia TaxID=40324 RepID=UPI000C149BDD|nr:hypothetical protein [Stenotrophomonas maltophilia]MBH1864147.1 hypothetical protein [Stenotrophomonas maltophilia]PZS50247.1 hypothetical protein A7X57_05855 [Stenotrophomonas maltophilia]UXB21941.1 hypothetical protein K7566_09655 [Stenotrophomonas maltophilia]